MSGFDKDKCANAISNVAFEVFQSLPNGEDLVLTKHGIGKPKRVLTEAEFQEYESKLDYDLSPTYLKMSIKVNSSSKERVGLSIKLNDNMSVKDLKKQIREQQEALILRYIRLFEH